MHASAEHISLAHVLQPNQQRLSSSTCGPQLPPAAFPKTRITRSAGNNPPERSCNLSPDVHARARTLRSRLWETRASSLLVLLAPRDGDSLVGAKVS